MVPPSSPSKREGGKGLSRMHGNGHVRFLGGGAAAMSPCYPIAADAVVKERGPPPPADPNPHPRRHAPRPFHHLVSGHARQRWSASNNLRCCSLNCPTVSGALHDDRPRWTTRRGFSLSNGRRRRSTASTALSLLLLRLGSLVFGRE